MHDESAPDDCVRAVQLQKREELVQLRFPGLIRSDVAQISKVMFLRPRRAMTRARRIEVPASRSAIRSGTIALFMDVKSMFTRRKSREFCDDANPVLFAREGDGAANVAARRCLQRCLGRGDLAFVAGLRGRRRGAGSIR